MMRRHATAIGVAVGVILAAVVDYAWMPGGLW